MPTRALPGRAGGKPQRPTTLEAPRPTAAGSGAGAGAAPPAGLLTLQLAVDRPDIALVEDLTDISTRAVVFDVSLSISPADLFIRVYRWR